MKTFVMILGVMLMLVSPVVAQTAKEESAEFFKKGEVLKLDVILDKAAYESLQREPRKYVKAQLKQGDKVVVKDLAVHLRGAVGSFRGIDDKPGITCNADKYVSGQRFYGMDKFHLANSAQDPSYLSELICGDLARAMGIPAARIGHAIVSINGKPKGFYYLKEGYDKYFLKQNFGTADGNFYDGGFLKDLDQEMQLLSGKDDVKPQTDLKALMAAAAEPKVKERFEKLEKLLDMDKFISYMVHATVTWDWDGYPYNRNNYRMYHHPKTGKITFIPSGMDQMFADPRGTILPGFQGAIARAVMETPKGKELYLARLAEVNQKIFIPETYIKRLDEMEKKVQPALASVDAGAGKDYKNQVNRLRDSIKVRHQSIEEQLKQIKK